MDYKRIREIRKGKKITLGELSGKTGIHRVRLSRIEEGSEATRVIDLEKICEVLGLEVRIILK